MEVSTNKARVCAEAQMLLIKVATHMQAHTSTHVKVGQNRIYTPYINVHFIIFLPKLPHIHL